MKVLYVGLAGSPCGGTRILAEHLNRLSDRGHDCELMLLIGNPIDWMPVRFKQSVARYTEGRALVPRYEHYDVVVATEINTWPMVATYSVFPNADRRKVFIQMVEHLFFKHDCNEWNKFRKWYDFLMILEPIVISEWLYDWAAPLSITEPHIVPNGANTDMFYPDPMVITDDLRILIEGHGKNEAKDVADMSYRAAMWLRDLGVDFELWGFSQYPQPHEFDQYWRLPDQDTIRQIYSTCDILLKASKYEGRSCVEIEAMACGCAVNRAILTGDDDLKHGHNCLKTRYGNQSKFQSNLLAIVQDKVVMDTLKENGLAYVREHLNWDNIVPLLEKALIA